MFFSGRHHGSNSVAMRTESRCYGRSRRGHAGGVMGINIDREILVAELIKLPGPHLEQACSYDLTGLLMFLKENPGLNASEWNISQIHT